MASADPDGIPDSAGHVTGGSRSAAIHRPAVRPRLSPLPTSIPALRAAIWFIEVDVCVAVGKRAIRSGIVSTPGKEQQQHPERTGESQTRRTDR
jgi:hypothetical protein